MNKTVRIICAVLAALMVMTTVAGALAMAAYAAESSSSSSGDENSSSSSSSEDDEDWEVTGSLRLLGKPKFQLVDNDGVLVKDEDVFTSKLQKNRTYRVVMNVLDSKTSFEDVRNSNSFNAYDSEYDYYVEDLYGVDELSAGQFKWDAYVVSDGGNLVTVTNTNNGYLDPVVIAYDRGGATGLILIFYIECNGKGRRMNLDVWYPCLAEETVIIPGEESGSMHMKEKTYRVERNISLRVGEAPLDEDAEEEEEDAYKVATPNIIVTSYSYGGQPIMAGSEFPLHIQFQNTSSEMNLENIIMEVTTSTDLSISNGSNSNFIDALNKGESGEKTLNIAVSTTIQPVPQQVTVKFTYEYILNKQRITKERTETLAIPIVQLDRFEVGELSAPDQLWPGSSNYLSIEYVNKGKGEVANLAARLETNVPGVSENQNLGNIEAGDSGTIDFSFTVNDPGVVEGKVIITYEDLKGTEKTVERYFTSTVMDMGGMGPDIPTDIFPIEPEETGPSKLAIAMAGTGGLLMAGLVFTVVVKKIKAKRTEDEDEDI